MEINRQQFTAHKGDVILFYPGDTYRAHADGEECNFLVTFFALETGSNIDLLAQRNYAGIYRHSQIKKASEKFFGEYIKNFQEQLSPDFQQYASFLNFIAELSPHLGRQIPFYAHARQTPNLRIHRLLEYMNEHCLEPLSNRELASRINMSEKYFISFFHSHIGKSPKQYLTECRMKHALVLLADSENTLTRVAEQLGFTDSYTFSKAFKRYYGEAPGTLRKELFIDKSLQ